MSTITAYAKARAVAAGRAQPIATVRHVHVGDRPLVFVPLTLAGEANAPVAALVGTDPASPSLLVVPQPRNREQRFAFAAALAAIIVSYVESFARDVEPHRDGVRFTGAPQLVVPNAGGVGFVRLFGRSTRFRRADGPYPVHPAVPQLGRWLTFFAERAEHPGSSMLLALTDALALHWASGQSAVEDANLAALLAWIAPPTGVSAVDAARRAEDPQVCPPAGPATDPGFDNDVLYPLVAAGDTDALERALLTQLQPTWELAWQAICLLRMLPAGASVAERWAVDRSRFTDFWRHVAAGGPPQARRDGAVAAARRLAWLEQEQTGYEAQRAFDDPLVMASLRVSGEAFLGTVVSADPTRRVPSARGRLVTRPLVSVRTSDPVHLAPGTACRATSRRQQTATVVDVAAVDGASLVTLELAGGMGRAAVPAPGSVPSVGEELCYSSVLAENVPSPGLPAVEDTPWTHGGPPPVYDADAVEVWE